MREFPLKLKDERPGLEGLTVADLILTTDSDIFLFSTASLSCPRHNRSQGTSTHLSFFLLFFSGCPETVKHSILYSVHIPGELQNLSEPAALVFNLSQDSRVAWWLVFQVGLKIGSIFPGVLGRVAELSLFFILLLFTLFVLLYNFRLRFTGANNSCVHKAFMFFLTNGCRFVFSSF